MRRTAQLATVLLVGLAAAAVPGGGPAAARAACVGPASDFNGDGIADAAFGQPDPSESGKGLVHVVYGTRAGLTANASGSALDDQLLAASADVSPTFGMSLATGDFDGDGCADLAIGQPGATVDGVEFAGKVTVFWGDLAGISTGLALSAGSVTGVDPHADGQFGTALAAGDVNGDGLDDLVAGEPLTGGGAVYVFPGRRDRALGTGGRRFTQGDGTVPGTSEPGDQFGIALATGDFDHDGRVDVAIGVPGENDERGGVRVVRGTTSTALLTATGAQAWNQGSAGLAGTPEVGDEFGLALAGGDFDGDGRTDLAIGSPTEEIGGIPQAGFVNVLYSAGSAGLSGSGSQGFSQDQPGLGGAQPEALFGDSFAAGDFNGDGRADLAIGAPGQTVAGADSAGAVDVLPGTAGGLTVFGAGVWSEATPGIAGTPEVADLFGNALVALRVTAAGRDDLLVGAFGEQFGSDCEFTNVEPARDGAALLIPGSPSGLTATGSQLWSLNTAGLKGSAGQICGFATAVG